jgi:PAS domain S-box-containing protein
VSNSRSAGSPAELRRGRGSRRASAGGALESPDPISKEEESHLAQFFLDQADEFIAWLDPDARLVYANAAASRALGYSPAEFSSLRVWDISPTTPESWPARWTEMKQRLSQTFVAELRTRSGGIVPVRLSAKYATFGGKEYLLCSGHELCERKTIPEASDSEDAGQSEERFSALFESTVGAVFLLEDGRVVDSNRNAREAFGGSREQIREEFETMLRESPALLERMDRALRGEEATFDWHSRRPDGSRFNIVCTLTRIEIEGIVRLLAVAVDVTARRKSERTLAQLSGRLLQLQDEERRRIARDLHDTTGQNLGALSINLSMILSTAAQLDPRARDALQESIALADSCVREIRTMSYLLHPPLLDELGLVSALRAYADGYSERTGLRLDLDLPAHMRRLPQAIEIALFRIVQEGLSNIHRHSGSKRAFLRLRHMRDSVELELVDYGRGLPPGVLDRDIASASRIGVGIAGMRERARQLGGHLTMASGENGTALHVVLPATVVHPAAFPPATSQPVGSSRGRAKSART